VSLLKADGFDDCIVGVCERAGQRFLVYDKDKVLDQLSRDMGYVAAVEYFDFNIAGGWVGDSTPGYVEEFDEAFEYEREGWDE
jgi:hypothetical protein